MSILLTGATGFIGRHYIEHNPVSRIVVRERCDDLNHIEQHVVEDMSQCPDDAAMFSGCDTVVYLAGIAHNALSSASDAQISQVNHHAVISFAQRAAKHGIKRFIFLSSTIVYGVGASALPIDENTPAHPTDAAAMAKYHCERDLLALSDNKVIEVVIVRSPLVYGEGVKGNLARLIKLGARVPVLPFGSSKALRHYIDVKTLVKALDGFAHYEHVDGETYLVADSEPLSLPRLIDVLLAPANKTVLHLPVPVGLFKMAAGLTNNKQMYQLLFNDFALDTKKYTSLLERQQADS
ncbi:NAD-dependent epimerase/dehydratase family protein [Vibrio ulleungensis]|uniref:NAD-dependent epimerase/dehydratase family protein n=1 Tax=Vibrio ulleungensis TaxID=2807619 RepID=A0ABS2HJM2_9VIBR|nr:NAD-dependent epimerase/dehydratase family protein [Vibrio ulleungensis]MBM7037708.1 NAD-dependent epimerase/dehydratase family protein [Vibrio ulleungensis]